MDPANLRALHQTPIFPGLGEDWRVGGEGGSTSVGVSLECKISLV